jgi:hypothetical protein
VNYQLALGLLYPVSEVGSHQGILNTGGPLPVIKVETTTVRHTDDLSVSCESTAVKCTATYCDAVTSIIINTCQLDACCGREQSIASFAPTHAWCFQDPSCEVIVEWIITCWVVPIQGNTLEAVNGIDCSASETFYLNTQQSFLKHLTFFTPDKNIKGISYKQVSK